MLRTATDEEKTQAHAILTQWLTTGKCHRIEQVLRQQPAFHPAVADITDRFLRRGNIPSKGELATQMLSQDVPGFCDAIIAYDAKKTSQNWVSAEQKRQARGATISP
jgi:hypothetical protein